MRRSYRFRTAVLAAVALFVSAATMHCIPSDSGEGDGPRTFQQDTGNADAFADGSAKIELPDGGIACRGSFTLCDGSCVDLQTNFDHCGACGNTCSAGGIYCGEGKCQCIEEEFTNCDGACVDTTANADHCGACGNSCAQNEKCKDGTCETKTEIEQTVEETNKIRSMGYDCDTEGDFGPTHDVEGNEELHKAAQMHADSMAENQFFSHTYRPPDCDPNASQECHDFAWRVAQTDYQGQPLGENIARGQTSPEAVVQGWADSDGHCRNMLNPQATEIGIGYAEGTGGPYWVQVFGTQ